MFLPLSNNTTKKEILEKRVYLKDEPGKGSKSVFTTG